MTFDGIDDIDAEIEDYRQQLLRAHTPADDIRQELENYFWSLMRELLSRSLADNGCNGHAAGGVTVTRE